MKRTVLFASCLTALMATPHRAEAAFTITFLQSGVDVVATGVGSLVTTGLTSLGGGTSSPQVVPGKGIVVLGPAAGGGFDNYRASLSSNVGFGPGNGATATGGSGPVAGLRVSSNELLVPRGYASGTSITSTATFANQTFASLGLAAGTYTYTYAVNGGTDSVIIQVGAIAGVPEPASLAMLVLALAGIGVAARGGRGRTPSRVS